MVMPVRRPLMAAALVLAIGLAAGGWFLQRAVRLEAGPEPTRLFQQVLAHVRRYGVDSLPEPELYRRAADGLLRQLDDEFATLLPGEATALGEPDDPGGLGIQFSTRDGRVTVIGVIAESPAARAGIRPGDQLLELDGRPVDASRRDLLLAALEGPPGTPVSVAIRRPRIAPIATFELGRERPRTSAVSAPVLVEGQVGYLSVALPGRGAGDAVRQAVEDLVKRGARALVLDLRGASGGELTEAASIAGLFLPEGATAAMVQGKSPEPRQVTGRRGNAFPDLPVAVLVDSLTADGGEVIAAALQDHDRALVIGQPTFGRGFSRESFTLAAGVAIRMSTETWSSPLGRPIPRDTAYANDSLAARPVVQSDGGRPLRAGGGIVPDSIVVPDSLSDAERQLLQTIGSSLAVLTSTVHQVATSLARSSVPDDDYRPGRSEVLQVVAALREAGVSADSILVDGAQGYLADLLGAEAVRVAAGSDALVRRGSRTDPVLRRAVALVREASSARALVFGEGER